MVKVHNGSAGLYIYIAVQIRTLPQFAPMDSIYKCDELLAQPECTRDVGTVIYLVPFKPSFWVIRTNVPREVNV